MPIVPIILLTLLIRMEDHGIIILTQGKLTELPIYANAHEKTDFRAHFVCFINILTRNRPKRVSLMFRLSVIWEI